MFPERPKDRLTLHLKPGLNSGESGQGFGIQGKG